MGNVNGISCEISCYDDAVVKVPRRRLPRGRDVKETKVEEEEVPRLHSLKQVVNVIRKTVLPIRKSRERSMKRTEKILELVQTEEKFVQILKRVVNMYMLPLMSKIYTNDNINLKTSVKREDIPLLRETEFKSLFAAVPDVLRASRRLLRDMKKIINSCRDKNVGLDQISKIASCFLVHFNGNILKISTKDSNSELFDRTCADFLMGGESSSDNDEEGDHECKCSTTLNKRRKSTANVQMMQAYASYITLYDTRTKWIISELCSNESFGKFVTLNQDLDPDFLDLASLLVSPVQRLPRYRLLLRDIMKSVPKHNTTYRMLESAMKGVDRLIKCSERGIDIMRLKTLKARLGVDVWSVNKTLLTTEDVRKHVHIKKCQPTRQTSFEHFKSVLSAVDSVVENQIPSGTLELQDKMMIEMGHHEESSEEEEEEEEEEEKKKKKEEKKEEHKDHHNTSFFGSILDFMSSHKKERWCVLASDRFIWAKVKASGGFLHHIKKERRRSSIMNHEFALRGVILLRDVRDLVAWDDQRTLELVLKECDITLRIEAESLVTRGIWARRIKELLQRVHQEEKTEEEEEENSKIFRGKQKDEFRSTESTVVSLYDNA